MKKLITLISFGSLVLWGFSPALSAESGRGFSLGASVGGFSAGAGANGLRFGGEFSYQFTDHLGLLFEVASGKITQNYESSDTYGYSYRDKSTYSSTPISASLLFIAPLGKGFSVYAGIGLGYHWIAIKDEWTSHYSWSEDDSKNETEKFDGLAPHFSLGAETQIFKRIAVFGEVKHVVGKTKFEKTEQDEYHSAHYKTDTFFGGTEVRVGLRFYFKG
jgi:opacity protein-like surface antigen